MWRSGSFFPQLVATINLRQSKKYNEDDVVIQGQVCLVSKVFINVFEMSCEKKVIRQSVRINVSLVFVSRALIKRRQNKIMIYNKKLRSILAEENSNVTLKNISTLKKTLQ